MSRLQAILQQQAKKEGRKPSFFVGAPAGTRTLDTRLKRAVLYLLSYWGICVKLAGMAGLEPTISESKSGVLPLHYIPMSIYHTKSRLARPFIIKWGGIWGSNPRHPEPQSGALPTELIPPYFVLARQEGFEPPTYCLEGSCSILLSYWRISCRPLGWSG